MFDILLGIASLIGCYLLGNAERKEMKLPPIMYWLTWVVGGVAGTVYVGSLIGGLLGVAAGFGLACGYVAMIVWTLRSK